MRPNYPVPADRDAGRQYVVKFDWIIYHVPPV